MVHIEEVMERERVKVVYTNGEGRRKVVRSTLADLPKVVAYITERAGELIAVRAD